MKRKQWYQKIAFGLIFVCVCSLLSPIEAKAADNLYLAHKYTEYAEAVVDLYEGNREWYKITGLYLEKGDKAELCFINASLWDRKSIVWTSNDETVAKVDGDGVVTAVGNGIAKITLTYTKIITQKKVSASATIYVGEENWEIQIGVKQTPIDISEMLLKSGEEQTIHVFGLPDSGTMSLYNITWSSSDSKVVTITKYGGVLKALKPGTATLTCTINHPVLGTTIIREIEVNVTENAYNKAGNNGWDNLFYLKYGENYIRLFNSPCLAVSAITTEKALYDTTKKRFCEQMDKLGYSGFVYLSDVSDSVTKGIEVFLHGLDDEYLSKEMREAAIMYLVSELTEEGYASLYADKVENALEKANDIVDKIKLAKDINEEIDIIKNAGLNLEAQEVTSILDYFMGDMVDEVENVLSTGLSMLEYATFTLCLYEAEREMLNDLKEASFTGKLAEDVQLLIDYRKQDPLDYFRSKYLGKTAAKSFSGLIMKVMNKELRRYTKLAHECIDMVADMSGVPDFSDMMKATHLMSYLTDVSAQIENIRWDLLHNFTSYSNEEIIRKIEAYEKAYGIYTAMRLPVIRSVIAMEQYQINHELTREMAELQEYDYEEHIFVAMNLFLDRNPDADEHEMISVADKNTVQSAELNNVVKEVWGSNAAEKYASYIANVQEIMDNLAELLVGTYFTTTKQPCLKERETGHGCAKCSTSSIVKAEWFKDTFGEVSVSKFPSHDVDANSRAYSGKSCFGFACFAQWYVFGAEENLNLVGKRVASGKLTKEFAKANIIPGDVLRLNNSHSVIVYEVNDDGIMVIDSNSHEGNPLNCLVQKHLIQYSNKSYGGKTVYVNRVTRWAELADDKEVAEEKVEVSAAEFGEWTTDASLADNSNYETQTKIVTVYSYTDRETTSSEAANLKGWSLIDTKSEWKEIVAPTTEVLIASGNDEYVKSETRETMVDGSVVYRYSNYCWVDQNGTRRKTSARLIPDDYVLNQEVRGVVENYEGTHKTSGGSRKSTKYYNICYSDDFTTPLPYTSGNGWRDENGNRWWQDSSYNLPEKKVTVYYSKFKKTTTYYYERYVTVDGLLNKPEEKQGREITKKQITMYRYRSK